MNIYKKLMTARMKLQAAPLKKSGKNTFAGYDYFELSDFLPAVQLIFNEVGLCGVVSYTADLATLTISETDGEIIQRIVITSPMGSAQLKACHEVQNIGAVETYQRRYLWATAMEIVEHDALDAVSGSKDGAPEPKAAPSAEVNDWIKVIDACQNAEEIVKTKASILEDYGSVKKVPSRLKVACVDRAAALLPKAA